MNEEYLEPSEQLVNMLREHYKDGPIKAVYDGDPDIIPRSMLPAICVVELGDVSALGATGTEDVGNDIQLRVVYNKQDDWGIKSPTDQLTDRKIKQLVGARDMTNKYTPGSLKGALRGMVFQGGAGEFIRQDMRFEFSSVVRPTGQNASSGLITREGILTITIDYRVMHY